MVLWMGAVEGMSEAEAEERVVAEDKCHDRIEKARVLPASYHFVQQAVDLRVCEALLREESALRGNIFVSDLG